MKKKEILRQKRHKNITLRMIGTSGVPRLTVHRSLSNLFASFIDDEKSKTMLTISTLDKEVKEKFKSGGNLKAAEFLGEVCAKRAKEKGISKLIFDRAGYLYHGRIKAFADSLRKSGLQF